MEAEGTAKNSIDLPVEKAVRLMRLTRGLMVPKAMRAIGFTPKDVDNQCKQMWTHHCVKRNDDDTPALVRL